MSKPRSLNDGDLKEVSGGTKDLYAQPTYPEDTRGPHPPPPPLPKSSSGGAGNTDSDEAGNTGGENEFYQG